MENATQRLVRFLAEFLQAHPNADHVSFSALTSDNDPDDEETLADLVDKADAENL